MGMKCKIDNDFMEDLNWFNLFVDSFNRKMSFANWQGPSDGTVFVDASLMGLGAVCENKFYTVSLPPYIRRPNRIVFYVMLNVLIALRVWGNLWCNQKVTIFCDNTAVVDVIEGNKTRDSELGLVLGEMLMLHPKMNAQLKVLHVMGSVIPPQMLCRESTWRSVGHVSLSC